MTDDTESAVEEGVARNFYGVSRQLREETNPRGFVAADRLAQAYRAFMNGNPTSDDCQIILVDLAWFSGYYVTTPIEAPAEVSKYNDGQRSVFERVMRYANPPIEELLTLQQAAQIELNVDNQQKAEL